MVKQQSKRKNIKIKKIKIKSQTFLLAEKRLQLPKPGKSIPKAVAHCKTIILITNNDADVTLLAATKS